jgi:hypothetical protein
VAACGLVRVGQGEQILVVQKSTGVGHGNSGASLEDQKKMIKNRHGSMWFFKLLDPMMMTGRQCFFQVDKLTILY